MRQGAVLSPSLFSLYIDTLLIDLESSGLGCHIGNYYYGSSAYADDLILLSPTRSGLQEMFDICYSYFNEHEIIISTNPDPAKSKTKCIFFPYGQQEQLPTPILMGNTKLPWVDEWPHLGNNLNRHDFKYPGNGSLKQDLLDKRGKFIGKFHGLFQEFGFMDSDLMLKVIHIYATAFYGSQLWDFSGNDATKLYNSWNSQVRLIFRVPNTTHRYLIEKISNSRHIKFHLYKRYLSFIHSILRSQKDCLSVLGKRMINDYGSVTAKNLLLISNESQTNDVLSMAPEEVVSMMQFAPVPAGEEWRYGFLSELLDVRKHNLELDFEDDVGFTNEELDNLIRIVAAT